MREESEKANRVTLVLTQGTVQVNLLPIFNLNLNS